MPATSPLEILAEEIGAVAGRIERESGLRITAAISDLLRRDAERELRFAKFEQEIQQRVDARLATIRDGVDGKDGAPGRDGVNGTDGRDGVDGKDGEAGVAGRDGQDGIHGRDGTGGAPGRDGIDGKDGAAGVDGKDGLPGAAGRDGIDGVKGIDGTNGRDGLDGKDGERGLQGERGPEGRLPIVKAWTEVVHYEGEVRHHQGATYQAVRDTGKQPGGSDDWACIAERGFDGQGFKVRGTYSQDKAYDLNDVVACNNGSFAALKDGAGICPGPDWQLLAGPGKRGDKGLPGERGLRGERGLEAPAIVGWVVKPTDYTAVPVMSDGTKAAAVEMRSMFEQFQEETR